MNWQVACEAVTKSFVAAGRSPVTALDAVDLHLKEGEFCVLVGDSGSGKTTLMRCIAGLERPDSGTITLRGSPVFASGGKLLVPTQARRIGMVFQSYAIWPHLTVAENVALPLRNGVNKIAKSEIGERVRQALDVVGLASLADRPAPALSGGQQQRVALARALAVSTDLLIMDEPMSNLDARLREDVRRQIKEVTRRFRTTVLYVTHDQGEAMALADEIAIVRAGRVIAKGPPDQLYANSNVRRVADFFGPVNYFEGEVTAPGQFASPVVGLLSATRLVQSSGKAVLGIRSNETRVVHEGGANRVRGIITDEVYQGDHSLLTVKVDNLVIQAQSRRRHHVDEAVWIEISAGSLRQFDS